MRLISAGEDQLQADRLAEMRDRVAVLAAQNADLLATVLSLKTAGASSPVTPLPAREVDGVSQTIATVAGSNAPLRRQLGQFARQMLSAGADEGEVVRRLLHWDEAADGVAD